MNRSKIKSKWQSIPEQFMLTLLKVRSMEKNVRWKWASVVQHVPAPVIQLLRKAIRDFWSVLGSKETKKMFYLKAGKGLQKKRKKRKKLGERTHCFIMWQPRKKHTANVTECKDFYLLTLDIDQKWIFYAHNTKTSDDVPSLKRVPPPLNRTSSSALNWVHERLTSVSKVESHYWRSKTSRKYLDSSLNLQKMFEFYEEKCRFDSEKPVWHM